MLRHLLLQRGQSLDYRVFGEKCDLVIVISVVQRDFVPGRSESPEEGAVGREVLPDEGERGTDTSIFGNPRQKLDAGFLASGVHVVRKNQRAAFTIRPAPGIQVAPSESTQTEKIRSIVRIRPWIALLFGEFRQRLPEKNAGEYYAQITGNPVVRKRQLASDGRRGAVVAGEGLPYTLRLDRNIKPIKKLRSQCAAPQPTITWLA